MSLMSSQSAGLIIIQKRSALGTILAERASPINHRPRSFLYFLNGTKHETPIPYAAFITQTIIANIRLGLNGKVNKSIEITASYALMRYRQMTQGQLELENREIPHAAAVRARME
jgi:hypothetical protein